MIIKFILGMGFFVKMAFFAIAAIFCIAVAIIICVLIFVVLLAWSYIEPLGEDSHSGSTFDLHPGS